MSLPQEKHLIGIIMMYDKENDSKKILLLFQTKNFILYLLLHTTSKSMIYDNILRIYIGRRKK
jgi:hypothetical protein